MGNGERLIVGLGNPGSKYELTRHNAGFLALDYFADQHHCSLTTEKWQGTYCRDRIGSERFLLVKPQTYMNKSGLCLARFADFYKIEPADILVVHDDLDLPAGKIKVVAKGGAGGHNGIRSIIDHLGTSDFSRLKIGIGRPERDEQGRGVPVDRYVLGAFSDQDCSIFNERLPLIEEAIELFITRNIATCMNRINGQ